MTAVAAVKEINTSRKRTKEKKLGNFIIACRIADTDNECTLHRHTTCNPQTDVDVRSSWRKRLHEFVKMIWAANRTTIFFCVSILACRRRPHSTMCVCVVCTSNRQNMPPNTFIRIRYISCYEFHKLWYTIAQHCVSVCIPFRGSVSVCARKCNEKLNTAERKSKKKRNTWYSRVM